MFDTEQKGEKESRRMIEREMGGDRDEEERGDGEDVLVGQKKERKSVCLCVGV